MYKNMTLITTALKLKTRLLNQQFRNINTTSILSIKSPIPFQTIYQTNSAPLFIESFNSKGFTCSGDYTTLGPLLIVQGLPYQWKVNNNWKSDFDLRALKVFEIIRPKPELVLFGMGKTSQPLPRNILDFLNELGIQADVMDTRNACSTYNVLIEEGRLVAAVVLPPKA